MTTIRIAICISLLGSAYLHAEEECYLDLMLKPLHYAITHVSGSDYVDIRAEVLHDNLTPRFHSKTLFEQPTRVDLRVRLVGLNKFLFRLPNTAGLVFEIHRVRSTGGTMHVFLNWKSRTCADSVSISGDYRHWSGTLNGEQTDLEYILEDGMVPDGYQFDNPAKVHNDDDRRKHLSANRDLDL